MELLLNNIILILASIPFLAISVRVCDWRTDDIQVKKENELIKRGEKIEV